jgi:alpha-tubulin suppressor-like RCC1 family protein
MAVELQQIWTSAASEVIYIQRSDGSIWGWGKNIYDQLGSQYPDAQVYPVPIEETLKFENYILGDGITYANNTAESTYAWGKNSDGELGLRYVSSLEEKALVTPTYSFDTFFPSYCDSYGLTSSGVAYSWGANTFGELGDGSLVQSSDPVLVTGNHTFTEITSAGFHVFAKDSSGTFWSWGRNVLGELGGGTVSDYETSPVIVLNSTLFEEIHPVYRGGAGLTSAGQVYIWGHGSYGQFGNGSLVSYNATAQLVLATSEKPFMYFDVGARSFYGVTADNNLYAWGYNGHGQIGNNSITDVSTPTQILSGFQISEVHANANTVYAQTADNELYSWGSNEYGQVGDGTTTDALEPTQIIFPMLSVELNSSLASPQVAGTLVTFTSIAVESDSTQTPKYQYEVNDTIIQEYSESSTFNWTATEAGEYTVTVSAYDLTTDAVVTNEIIFVITEAVSEIENSSSEDTDETLADLTTYDPPDPTFTVSKTLSETPDETEVPAGYILLNAIKD